MLDRVTFEHLYIVREEIRRRTCERLLPVLRPTGFAKDCANRGHGECLVSLDRSKDVGQH